MLSQYSVKKLLETKDTLEAFMRSGTDTQRHIVLYGRLKQELDKRKISSGEWLLKIDIVR